MATYHHWLKLIPLVFPIFIAAVKTQQTPEKCQTPNQQPGICISIYSCQPMMDVIETLPRNISQEARQFLRNFSCGYEKKRPKVCCPNKPIVLSTMSHLRIDLNSPPNVDKHKNVNLLPTEICGLPKYNVIAGFAFGSSTGVFKFPWMAMLLYRESSELDNMVFTSTRRCGGTIINDRYILTAAHCIDAELVAVRLGEHDIRDAIDCENVFEYEICAPHYKQLSIEKTITHKLYNRTTAKHDIALLRVPPIQYTDAIKPVCLPLNNARTYNLTNRNGVVTGWGMTESGLESPELLYAELPILSLKECQEKYKNIATVSLYTEMATLTHQQMCAGGRTLRNSCKGDSGGPLHVPMLLYDEYRYVQQGILSFGPTTCGLEDEIPGVYTRVAYYMKWILDNIEP